MIQTKYSRFFYVVLVCVLFLPIFESGTNFIEVKKLNGSVETKDTIPQFSIKAWLDGSYQSQKEKIVNDSFGFRNICVRINNQIDFSLFNKTHSPDISVGKEGYLFGTHTIDGYFGNNFLGTPSLVSRIKKLQFISDTLAKLGKTFILVIAPNKSFIYPEYLPEYPYPFRDTTNYAVSSKLLKQSTIHYIDFNNYMILNKNRSKYALEPKTGVHWSTYGASIAGDSIIKYIENAIHISMPKVIWKKISMRPAEQYDIDAEKTLNLLVDIPSPLLAYPEIEFKDSSNTTKPRVMTVGDSFYWELNEGFGIEKAFSNDSKYWYYFTKINTERLSRQEVKDELSKSDVVMFITAEYSFTHMGWGFVDSAYCLFKGISSLNNKSNVRSEKLAKMKEVIKESGPWLENIEKGAYEKGIPLDSAITGNANWIIDNENKK